MNMNLIRRPPEQVAIHLDPEHRVHSLVRCRFLGMAGQELGAGWAAGQRGSMVVVCLAQAPLALPIKLP